MQNPFESRIIRNWNQHPEKKCRSQCNARTKKRWTRAEVSVVLEEKTQNVEGEWERIYNEPNEQYSCSSSVSSRRGRRRRGRLAKLKMVTCAFSWFGFWPLVSYHVMSVCLLNRLYCLLCDPQRTIFQTSRNSVLTSHPMYNELGLDSTGLSMMAQDQLLLLHLFKITTQSFIFLTSMIINNKFKLNQLGYQPYSIKIF